MPLTPEGFEKRLKRLKADLVEQGRRVQEAVERAIEAVFERNAAKAQGVIHGDTAIDHTDVAIERTAVELLGDATRDGAALDDAQLRLVLTIVKVNNELERIADGAVNIAEQVETFVRLDAAPPETFRVMANSVAGILEATDTAFDEMNTTLARTVLLSDDAVIAFKSALLRETQERIAAGQESVDVGFALQVMATELERMADHCTNIAEQVIYVTTGAIVRHAGGKWTDADPNA
ncbi:MAG: phosphate transport system regulatory protein PhoU [Phycisphaerales bacterium]|nr:MAG: phosphate transport system regulatory protein PhoU [Phycisphaerales bacterium]